MTNGIGGSANGGEIHELGRCMYCRIAKVEKTPVN